MIKRIESAATWAIDILASGSLCAAFGALALPIALLVTDLSIALLRHGRGVLATLDPIVLGLLGCHALSVTAIFGGVLGFGYAMWTGLSFGIRSR